MCGTAKTKLEIEVTLHIYVRVVAQAVWCSYYIPPVAEGREIIKCFPYVHPSAYHVFT